MAEDAALCLLLPVRSVYGGVRRVSCLERGVTIGFSLLEAAKRILSAFYYSVLDECFEI